MADLAAETVVARRPDPLTAPVDGELVLLNPTNSRYFGLDAIAKRIWELLEEPQSVESLCGTLQDEYDVEPEACREDVLAFLERLQRAELLELR